MVQKPPDLMSAEAFAALCPVSRETIDKLELYIDLLIKWNATINLVSNRSLEDPWRRHILDSAQLAPLFSENIQGIVDLGSGAGLPGLVLALLQPGKTIHLIESDQRKAAFLREAARALNCQITIHADRIENVIDSIPSFQAITARALAPLSSLMNMIKPVLDEKKLCIFPKTKGIIEELKEIEGAFVVSSRTVPSLSDPRGEILVLEAKKGG